MELYMDDYSEISRGLRTILELRYEPVGVTLYREGDPPPPETPFTRENLKSYCQAVVLAGLGRRLLLAKEQLGCKLGTTALGFEAEPEPFLDDGVLEKYGVGLFATEEAAAATIRRSFYLEAGRTRAALIAPLSSFTAAPQVVVFTADSEQVMWLLYALNYQRGGRLNLPQSGGALGGCADITVLPLLEKVPNVTFLGLGCRLKTALDPCHLMLGAPGEVLPELSAHLLAMGKPIAMLKKSRAGEAK
jgi:uncharacterized protein (DUF169 family)